MTLQKANSLHYGAQYPHYAPQAALAALRKRRGSDHADTVLHRRRLLVPVSCPPVTSTAAPHQTSIITGDTRAWASALSALFVELDVVIAETGARSRLRAEKFAFGDFELVRTSQPHGAFSVLRSERLLSRSTSNSFFIACMLNGQLTMTQASRSITLGPSDLAVLDSTQPYRIDVDGRLDVLWVRVPRHRIEGRISRSARVLAQRIDGSRGAGHLTSTLISAALREADQLSGSEALRISNTVLDLLCLSLDVSPGPDRDRPRELLRRIQNYIDANLGDPELSCRSIAGHHGISTGYLNRIFRREGLTAARWLRVRRLELCRQRIEQSRDGDLPISSIAYAHGFNSVSSFNRAFKRHFGTTPGSLRQLASPGGETRQPLSASELRQAAS